MKRAHVPFSRTERAAIILLADGTWIPGVRVESASFSLTLPALLNAYTTAVALDCVDEISAVVTSHPARPEEELYIEQIPGGPYLSTAEDAWIRSHAATSRENPAPAKARTPVVNRTVSSEDEGIEMARDITQRAYAPLSDFPVGALLETENGRFIPGVNVEHPDWSRVLCAERNALGTAMSYGLETGSRFYLSCVKDRNGSPCGACRQLLVELASGITLWMDRHDKSPERATPPSLLPGSFQGRAILDSE